MNTDERWPFFTIDLELTNHCGQNCLFCPREKLTRPKGFMELALLQKLLTRLGETGSRVTFCGMGNPLLYPQLNEAGAFCRKTLIKYGMTIQAPALDSHGIARISDFEPNFIEISLPTLDDKLYSQLYPGQQLETALNNIADLVASRKSTRGISITGVRTTTETWPTEQILKFWADKGLNCRIMPCHSRGGNMKSVELLTAAKTGITQCGLFATHAFITWQGKLLACCHDLTGTTEIADLNSISLKEAGKLKNDILLKQMPWAMCQNCDEPAALRPLPDRPYPESAKARSRFLGRLVKPAAS